MKNDETERLATEVHHAAATGYPEAAESYVRGRPTYPDALALWLRDVIGLDATKTVIDLGAGTGKFTPLLVRTGARVIAIEPVKQLRDKLIAALPGVEAHAGTATAIPLPDASVDAVLCAQSFHWFATTEALVEITRVLVPGGKLGLVWNMRDARVPWVARLDAIVNRHEGDAPRHASGAWRTVFPFAGLGALHEQRFTHAHTGAPEDVLFNRVRSTSFIAALPQEARAQVDDEVRDLIATEPSLVGRDVVTVPYTTLAFHAEKVAPPGAAIAPA